MSVAGSLFDLILSDVSRHEKKRGSGNKGREFRSRNRNRRYFSDASGDELVPRERIGANEVCYSCQRVGHIADDCIFNRKMKFRPFILTRKGEESNSYCYNCSAFGHRAESCTAGPFVLSRNRINRTRQAQYRLTGMRWKKKRKYKN